MSMNTYPASGYLVSLTQLKATLVKLADLGSTDASELLKKLSEDSGYDISENLEEIGELVGAWLESLKCPACDTPFIADDETVPELEPGELYFWFDEDDLFVKTYTQEFKELRKLALVPELKQWTTFG